MNTVTKTIFRATVKSRDGLINEVTRYTADSFLVKTPKGIQKKHFVRSDVTKVTTVFEVLANGRHKAVSSSAVVICR